MTSTDNLKQIAANYGRLARQARTLQRRSHLSHMTATWTRLADRVVTIQTMIDLEDTAVPRPLI
jgi:hypothetical protein